MTPSRPHILSEILALSQQLRQLAAGSKWDQVQVLEAQRQPLIQACFPLDDALPDAERMAEQLRQIIDLDRQVVAMAGAAREEAGEALNKMGRGRVATQAYAQTGS